MNKLHHLLLFFFNTDVPSTKTQDFWTEEKEIEKLKKIFPKILEKKLITKKEFNPNLKIDTSQNKNLYLYLILTNNLGIKNFNKDIDKISKFKFSKIERF